MVDPQELADIFMLNGWKWTIDGQSQHPTANDMTAALDTMRQVLLDSEDGGQLEMGRLIMKRHGNTFDLYLYHGTQTV